MARMHNRSTTAKQRYFVEYRSLVWAGSQGKGIGPACHTQYTVLPGTFGKSGLAVIHRPTSIAFAAALVATTSAAAQQSARSPNLAELDACIASGPSVPVIVNRSRSK